MTRSPAATIRTVADHYGLDVAEITQADHRERGPTAARARRVITYVLRSRGRTWAWLPAWSFAAVCMGAILWCHWCRCQLLGLP